MKNRSLVFGSIVATSMLALAACGGSSSSTDSTAVKKIVTDTTNEVVRRALASALQRDGLVHSLGDGFRLLENCVVDYMHCGYLEGELQYIVCSSEGETRYGDFVEKPLEITLIEI